MKNKDYYIYNYRKITDKLKKSGFDCDQLKRSMNELSCSVDGTCFLKEVAYKPTGLALGCPLPKILSSQIKMVAENIENRLIDTFELCNNAIAYIPETSYHITVLNRSHFDDDSKIVFLEEALKNKAEEIIKKMSIGSIEIHISGILLTQSGRLLVSGYPLDDKLQQIRCVLSSSIHELSVNIPILAHIKIGHLVLPLSLKNRIKSLIRILEYGNMIDCNIIFKDLYTPAGRIKF